MLCSTLDRTGYDCERTWDNREHKFSHQLTARSRATRHEDRNSEPSGKRGESRNFGGVRTRGQDNKRQEESVRLPTTTVLCVADDRAPKDVFLEMMPVKFAMVRVSTGCCTS
jgi:hypothetical protein